MTYLKLAIFLTLLCAGSASADIWKWVDVDGETHLVDTKVSIYTWVDETGKAYYSDTPDHEDAVAIQLVWVSKGSLESITAAIAKKSDDGIPGETEDQRVAREGAEAYYCKRATEIYESYKNAPRLYKTNDAGEREFLSDADAKVTLGETKTKMDDLCS